MTFSVPINDIRGIFLKAHLDIVNQLGGVDHLSRTTENNRWAILKHNWKLKYNVTLHNSKGIRRWTHLDFPDERAYIMFILRWA